MSTFPHRRLVLINGVILTLSLARWALGGGPPAAVLALVAAIVIAMALARAHVLARTDARTPKTNGQSR